MKTVHNHKVAANRVGADHRSWKSDFCVNITETTGNEENVFEVALNVDQVKTLMKECRNALINAKVIRGKRV